CVAGTPPSVDDGNLCTADACYPGVGIVHSPIPGCGMLPPDPATVAPYGVNRGLRFCKIVRSLQFRDHSVS
ncbi:MAG TPA: hypothetical protein VK433_01035, partial [Stellaceae bacterium]|nr:hypothetical protein [Stellaceae bacterium]